MASKFFAMKPFSHLHVHTEYSLLDGLSRVKPFSHGTSLIEKVKSHGISYNTIHSSVLHVEGDIYALVAKDLIITLSISADGATATKVAELDYYPTLENYPNSNISPVFLKLNSNIYVVAYITRGGSYPNYRYDDHLELIEISADGQTITSIGKLIHATNQSGADNNSLV